MFAPTPIAAFEIDGLLILCLVCLVLYGLQWGWKYWVDAKYKGQDRHQDRYQDENPSRDQFRDRG